jgi:alpha-tubulin suppressor-like RCC1 family protein
VQVTRTGDYVDVVVGERFGCALTLEGVVQCWGRGDRGQLGNGREQGSRGMLVDASTQMAGLSGPRLVAGSFHVCLVGSALIDPLTPSTAACWGFNPEGQLGPEANGVGPHPPTALESGSGVPALVGDLALGTTRTFGIDPTGRLVAWGGLRNLFGGAFAGGERAHSGQYVLDDPDDSAWLRLSARMDRLCGLRRAGDNGRRIVCADVYAVDRPDERPRLPDLRSYPDLVPWSDVAAGDNVTCGLGVDGELYCAGYNHFGQLGDGRRQSSEAEGLAPVRGGTLRFHQVSVGAGFACGVRRADGNARR